MVRNPIGQELHVGVAIGPGTLVPAGTDDPGSFRNLVGTGGGELDRRLLGLHAHEVHAGQHGSQLDHVRV